MELNAKYSKDDAELLNDATQVVGSLIYLTMTKLDIAYAVQLVSSQFISFLLLVTITLLLFMELFATFM